MDDLTSSLLSLHSIELALITAIVVYGIRRTVETSWPSLKKAAPETASAQTYTSHAAAWWNQVILYVLPIALGAVLPFIAQDFALRDASTAGIMIHGAICGSFSSLLYKLVRQGLKKRTGIEIPDSDDGAPEA